MNSLFLLLIATLNSNENVPKRIPIEEVTNDQIDKVEMQCMKIEESRIKASINDLYPNEHIINFSVLFRHGLVNVLLSNGLNFTLQITDPLESANYYGRWDPAYMKNCADNQTSQEEQVGKLGETTTPRLCYLSRLKFGKRYLSRSKIYIDYNSIDQCILTYIDEGENLAKIPHIFYDPPRVEEQQVPETEEEQRSDELTQQY